MAYPKAIPVAKHDILCPVAIIDAINDRSRADVGFEIVSDIESLASSMAESATPPPPDVMGKVSTVYTYPDAPTRPRPLSGAPRIWRLVERGLFYWSVLKTTTTTTGDDEPLRRW
jgi:hypothetical protein